MKPHRLLSSRFRTSICCSDVVDVTQRISRFTIRQQKSSLLVPSCFKNNDASKFFTSSSSFSHRTTRLFTSNTGGSDDKDREGTNQPKDATNNDDPFGVNFDDGEDRLGPTLPPKYKRDVATGRVYTNQIEAELTNKQKRLLKADPVTLQETLTDRIVTDWLGQEEKTDVGYEQKKKGTPMNERLNRLGKNIRESDMALNVLGRSVQAQAAVEELEDGTEVGRSDDGFSQHLTPQELQVFNKYLQQQSGIKNNTSNIVTEEDIPVLQTKKQRGKEKDDEFVDPDETELSLKWLTARAQRQMDDTIDDNPYSDLMPYDLNPSRLVNRKRAKQIPPRLLHHNNVQLLQTYLTPTGQIQNRVLTRLGARDQRRVAKLIRRARAVGLLPYMGQCKVERHGWIHAPDINKLRNWEQHLVDRGLVIQRKNNNGKKDDN